jgi:hypothetical protein
MKGDLFSSEYMVQPATAPGMTAENAKSIKYAVDGEMFARQGAMIAFRGNLQFERKGQGVGGMLKRAVTGEGLPLMAVRGQGEAGPARTTADLAEMEALLPVDAGRARLVNAGTMELGQTVCTVRRPRPRL